jgi:acyl-CoA synthetase (AMP-forming)/AMP-acid ligase II
MPLYHSSASILGCLVTFYAGATFSLGRKFSTKTFWHEVRASNATIIQYVGETCRYLLAAPPQVGPNGENLDKQNKVRVAFGNGLRPDVWNRFKERFDIPIIAEFYSATEGNGASWNYSGNDFTKGAIGRNGAIWGLALRARQVIVEIDWTTEKPWRDSKTGLCKKAATGKPGELLYAVDATDVERNFQGYFGNKKATEGKILRDVLKKGDAYFRTGDVVIWDDEGRMYFSDRIGDTFRWKSENVSTNEVSESIGLHPSVLEANVYGVQLPHHDGRAGCVALALAEEPSPRLMASLAEHVRKHLPRFAVPLFLRITRNMERTGTNKQQKHTLRLQGVDLEKVGNDELYWLKDGCYVKFTESDWEKLSKGAVKL